jgi:hypothetical protein
MVGRPDVTRQNEPVPDLFDKFFTLKLSVTDPIKGPKLTLEY